MFLADEEQHALGAINPFISIADGIIKSDSGLAASLSKGNDADCQGLIKFTCDSSRPDFGEGCSGDRHEFLLMGGNGCIRRSIPAPFHQLQQAGGRALATTQQIEGDRM